MVLKYFLKFDEYGDIDCLCKYKPQDCNEECKEYIVKLVEVNRLEEDIESLTSSFDKLGDSAVKLKTELEKASKNFKRGFI